MRNPRLSAALPFAIFAQGVENWPYLFSDCPLGVCGLSCKQKKILIPNK